MKLGYMAQLTLRKGRYLRGPNLNTWGLYLGLGSDTEEVRDSTCERDFDGRRFSLGGFEMNSTTQQGMHVTLGTETRSWLIASKEKTMASIPKRQRTDFCHNHMSLEEHPELHMRTHFSRHIHFSLVKTWAGNSAIQFLDFSPIEQCDNEWLFFKALSIWWFVTQK